jgi:hypothetical protein
MTSPADATAPPPRAAASPGDRFAPVIVGLLAAAAFGFTISDAVQIADSGELAAAACRLGVAHPPGYPLHTLLGHALCQLPISTPAFRVGLVSLLSGAISVALVLCIIMQLTGNRFAGVAAALSLATGDLFWRLSSMTEVFALNTALSLGVVLAALRAAAPGAGATALLLVGLLAGLGLSNHHSSVLVLPLVVLAVVRPAQPLLRLAARALALLAGLAAGLLPYLQLLLADPRVVPRWGETSTLPGLLHHVLRRDYGTFSLTRGGRTAPLENLLHYVASVPTQLGWLFWPVLLFGLGVLFSRAAARPLGRFVGDARRDLAAALGALPLLAGPGFLLLFNIDVEGIGSQIVERFYMLPNALLAVALGVGVAALDGTFVAGTSPARRGFWHGAVYLAVVLSALGNYGRADIGSSYTVDDYAQNALSSVERGALVVGIGDANVFGFLYAKEMLGSRPDVQYVDARLLLYPWYAEQKRLERPGFAYRFEEGNVDSLRLILGEMRRGIPVYVTDFYSQRVERAFSGIPVGPLVRLLPIDSSAPPPKEVYALNRRLFRGFLHRGVAPDPKRDPWSASILERYARTWTVVARSLYEIGDRRGALRALAEAQEWTPWQQAPDWFGRSTLDLQPTR